MKILQVYPISMKAKGSGIGEHVWNISTRLAKHHDVTLYGLNPNGRYPRFEVIDGVKIERFRYFYPDNAYYFSIELPLRLRKVEFDIVHGHGYHALPMHYSSLAKCNKFIATTHFHGAGHSVFRDSLFKIFVPFGKATLRKANVVIAVSEFEKKLLCEKFGLKEDKVVVIPNGVNFEEFKDLKRQKNSFKTILYVGRLEPYKGVHHLIEILPKLKNDVILEIVGRGSLREYLERRAVLLNVRERVFFYQNLPRHELLQKYVNADVFVLLSDFEAYSIVVSEALAAGTPCIVKRSSALIEWIDNATCYGVNISFDLKELINTIKHVLDEGIDRKAILKWIGKKIVDWNDVAKKVEFLYLN